jgi:hypothetical protein
MAKTVMHDDVQGNEFDLNEPDLFDGGPGEEFDPEAELLELIPMPPDDGIHEGFVTLSEAALKNGEAVQLKQSKSGPMVMAVLGVRVANSEGKPGMFLNDSYVNSLIFTGQTTSELANLLRLVGKPFKRGMTWIQMKDHVEQVFASCPEDGFPVRIKTQWRKSVVVTDPDTGEPVFQNGRKVYQETKGQKKVTAQHMALANLKASEMDEEEGAKHIEWAKENPHLYEDSEGTIRSVRASAVGFVA